MLSLANGDFFAPIGLLFAAGVTVHVLLRKRDVGTSIGWIGLAWLAPLAGGTLYFLLGINRVRRRARTLRQDEPDRPERVLPVAGRDDHLAPLEISTSRITRRLCTVGNTVTTFQNGDAAYPAMLEAIAGARISIALSTYILRADAAGTPFIEALIAAQRRGVAVRVIVDGIGSGYFFSRAYYRLRRNRVPTARFMHSLWPWRMPFLNLRTHKKVLVVDGAVGFAGGINIGGENVMALRPRHPVRDTHFRFTGPVTTQLGEAFARDWTFVTGEELDTATWFPPVPESGPAAARVITSGPDQDLEKIEYVALSAISCARDSVQVMTPYFLPEERLITALALAAMRGVAVDIVVPHRSNHRLLDWARQAHVGPLLEEGCRIWRNPAPFDHSKLMIIDGTWCLVGSANWDMRSFRLNFELNVEVYGGELAATLQRIMQAGQRDPLTFEELRRRPLPIRLRDAAVRLMLPYL